MDHYILDENNNHKLVSLMEWAQWFENSREKRIVAKTQVNDTTRVSTVFLGLDHSFSYEPDHTPILYETMVFTVGSDGKLHGGDEERSATREEAIKCHEEKVKKLTK